MENPNLDNIVLALLFASDEPLSARKIAALVEDVTVADVKQAIDSWNQRADTESWSIGIEQVAGGYRLATRPEYAAYVSRLYSGRRKLRLSRAGLETLAIVAYKQPVTRAEIESIRGVGCGSVVANLLERSLIQITGKAKVLGAPFLYGTTQEFLEYLGLNSIKDLPSLEDLEALLASEAAGESAVEGESLAVDAEDAALDQAESAEDEEDAAETMAALARTVEESMETSDVPGADDEELPVASGARVGVLVDEPVNRPLYSDPQPRPAAGGRNAPAEDTDNEAEEDAEAHRE
jgi:segregation and condensation protein B